MANILLDHIRRVIKERNLDFQSDTLPDLGDMKRVFQLKDLPFLDKEAAKTLFTTISSNLKKGLDALEISSDPLQIAEAEKLINKCFKILTNDTKEWDALLKEEIKPEHQDKFTQAIRTAFIFKALTDLYTTQNIAQKISREQTQYISTICNTMISPQDSEQDKQHKSQKRQEELTSKVFTTTTSAPNTIKNTVVSTPSTKETMQNNLLQKVATFFKRTKSIPNQQPNNMQANISTIEEPENIQTRKRSGGFSQ